MTIVDTLASDASVWQQFVATHPRGHLLQTQQWGQLKTGFGWDWDLITLPDDDTPLCGAMILYRSLPFHLGTIAYIPRGPIIDWDNPSMIEQLFERVHRAVRLRRAWACWVEPEVHDSETIAKTMSGLGYHRSKRTVQPRSTLIVDISPPEDDILMAMKPKTRYNIRLAERKGVAVRKGTLDDIARFHALMAVTGERDEFGIHTEAYYHRAFELFAPHDQVALFLAEYQGELLAALMTFAVGYTAWYIAGASSNQHRNLMAPYAVQWAAMLWAKSQGCMRYDLWGIPDASESQLEEEFADRSDGLWGVYRFKRGFGGEVVCYTGMWERPLTPLYHIAARLYTGFS